MIGRGSYRLPRRSQRFVSVTPVNVSFGTRFLFCWLTRGLRPSASSGQALGCILPPLCGSNGLLDLYAALTASVVPTSRKGREKWGTHREHRSRRSKTA